MNVSLSLSYLNSTNTSADNTTLVQCAILSKFPMASWDSSSFSTAAKVSTLLAVTANFITMPFTVFFNARIIFVVWKNPSLQVERVLVLAYLALGDFFVGLICKPLFIARGVFQLKTNNTNCAIETAYFFSAFILSIVTAEHLFLVTYERYVAIIHPYEYTTRITVKRLTYGTIVIWALNTPLAILYFVLLDVGVPVRYIAIYYVVTATIIVILMIYFYVRIFAVIRRTNRQIGQQQQNVNTNNPHTLQNHKGAITSALLLGCFLLSVIPMVCIVSFKQVFRLSFSDSVFLALRPWVLTFVQSSFINPIIYGLRVSELREKCFQLLGFRSNININNAP